MKELLSAFSEQYELLSELGDVYHAAALFLLLIIIVMLMRSNRRHMREFQVMEKQHKEIALIVEENDSKMRDRLATMATRVSASADSVNKNMRDKLLPVSNAVSELAEKFEGIPQAVSKVAAQGGSARQPGADDKTIALLEQHGVFMHDRLSELAARAEQIENALQEQKALQAQAQASKAEETPAAAAAAAAAAHDSSEAHEAIVARLTEGALGQRIAQIEQLCQALMKKESQPLDSLGEAIRTQLAELMMKERSAQQDAQSQATAMMSNSIDRLANEVDTKLGAVSERISSRFNDNLAGTLDSFKALHTQINSLIAAREEIGALGQDIASLSRLILNKGGGGGGLNAAYLPDMLTAMLPGDAFILNPMINGHIAAAQLMLPADQGAVIIDDRLSLKDFEVVLTPDASEEERRAARERFGEAVKNYVLHIAEHFISPPVTAGNALMFVNSESAFAEIQAHHKECVKLAAEKQVWMVSPTTLAAALNMARSALKDQKARVQLEKMRQALQQVMHEAQNFEARLVEIGDHVSNAMRSVQRAENAGVKFIGDMRDVASLADAPKNTPPAALLSSSDSAPPPSS